MARNGSGVYSNPYPNFVAGTTISSDQVDANNTQMATALTQSIAVDGQSTVTGNIPMSSKKFTGLAVGSASTDSLTLGQAQAEAFIWCGTMTGSADAGALSPTPAITAYAAGQRFAWKASTSANTGAMTVAISGLSTIAVQNDRAALAAGVHAASDIFMGVLDTASTIQIMKIAVSSSGTASTFEPTGDTSAGDDAAIGYTAAEGLILTGQGSTGDVTIKNDADAVVFQVPTGTTNVTVVGSLTGGSILSNAVTAATTNSNLTLLPNGSGVVTIDGLTYPSADGSASQLMKTNGSGVLSFVDPPASAGWAFVSGATASGTASVTFTGMEAGYDYMVNCYDFVPASDNKDLYVQYGTGATPTIQTSGYAYICGGIQNTTKTAESSTSASQVRLLGQGAGTGANEQFCFSIEILNPADSGSNTMSRGQGGGKDNAAVMLSQDFVFFRTTDEAVTAIKIFLSSSTNIATGKFFFYRRANA